MPSFRRCTMPPMASSIPSCWCAPRANVWCAVDAGRRPVREFARVPLHDDTVAVATGQRAIESAKERPPDLVLMDIRLRGEMNGIETAGHIRARLDVPVVYLTAFSDDATLRRAQITEPFGYPAQAVRRARASYRYRDSFVTRLKRSMRSCSRSRPPVPL